MAYSLQVLETFKIYQTRNGAVHHWICQIVIFHSLNPINFLPMDQSIQPFGDFKPFVFRFLRQVILKIAHSLKGIFSNKV